MSKKPEGVTEEFDDHNSLIEIKLQALSEIQ
jgi:hypothetical protein